MTPNAFAKSYFSYGLYVDSFVHLPHLVESHAAANVRVGAGSVRTSRFYKDFATEKFVVRPEINLTVRANKNTFCFDWRGLACCLVQDGNKVTVELDPHIQKDDFVPFITGPIFAVLLHQLGQLVLHSSVVEINNKAVLFMGDKGFGKSTLAAHLQTRGHRLISDDLAPVSFFGGAACTIPGHPQIRLFPDSIESLGFAPEAFRPVNSGTTKRQIEAVTTFSTDIQEIGCIFVLEAGNEIEIAELRKPMAFVEILRNSYLSPYIEAMENAALHFRQANDLVNSVPVFKLCRPRDFARMESVIDRVERHTYDLFN